MNQYKFVLFQDNAGEWRWRLQHSNGNTVADSGEGYKNKGDATHEIENLKAGISAAPVEELPGFIGKI